MLALAQAFRIDFSELPGQAGRLIGLVLLTSIEQDLQMRRSRLLSQLSSVFLMQEPGNTLTGLGEGSNQSSAPETALYQCLIHTHRVIKTAWSCHHTSAWCHLPTRSVCSHSVL